MCPEMDSSTHDKEFGCLLITDCLFAINICGKPARRNDEPPDLALQRDIFTLFLFFFLHSQGNELREYSLEMRGSPKPNGVHTTGGLPCGSCCRGGQDPVVSVHPTCTPHLAWHSWRTGRHLKTATPFTFFLLPSPLPFLHPAPCMQRTHPFFSSLCPAA
jgi:hypothetical protein